MCVSWCVCEEDKDEEEAVSDSWMEDPFNNSQDFLQSYLSIFRRVSSGWKRDVYFSENSLVFISAAKILTTGKKRQLFMLKIIIKR